MLTNLNKLLAERQLPPLKEKDEMLNVLIEQEYGIVPKPTNVTFSATPAKTRYFCAGKATATKITATCEIKGKTFSFPFYGAIPNTKGKHPFFIHVNFHDNIPDEYMPTEELIDNGFAVFSFCYTDVTSDDNDFTNGLAGVLYENGERGNTDAGKIAMWTWAAQRVMDYAHTLGDILDLNCGTICGHSRLGKTALFTAATDERFAFAYSNDSGCSGAALSRGKVGEHIDDICQNFPFWFCKNYQQYRNNEHAQPFDQHYLIAAIAPRKVLVGSALEDEWADPNSEFLSCVAASDAFENPFVCDDRLPQPDDCYFEGDVGYHLRHGMHYFSRLDWQRLIQFIHKKG